MSDPRDFSQFDPRLRPFLEAKDEDEAQRRLDDVVETIAAPLAERIAGAVARRGGDERLIAAEDLAQEALLRLARHLRSLRAGRGQAVQDFEGYVARTTYNVWHEHLREVHPERVKLKDRVRYVLRHSVGFALWRDANGRPLCGRAEWRVREDAVAEASLEAIGRRVPAPASRDAAGLTSALAAIFERADAPIALDDLIELFRMLGWIAERASVSLEDAAAVRADPTPHAADPVAGLVHRERLASVWSEIAMLPPKQRAALLLNLRESHGGADLSTLLQTGTASFEAIAAAVDVSVEELAALWDRLPLDDAAIAERLGTTARNVISLRQSARQRLARRLRGAL